MDDSIAEQLDEMIARRDRVRREFGPFYDAVLRILQEHDPVGIAFAAEEYDPEVSTILPRLGEAHSVDDCRKIVYEEFVRWFSDSDARSWEERLASTKAGPEENYQGIAEDIWSLWTARNGGTSGHTDRIEGRSRVWKESL